MKNIINKIIQYPEERPVNKIMDLGGRLIQAEGIKNDALKELEKNDNYYAGMSRMNYELIAENTRLRKKCNRVIAAYNRLTDKFNKMEKLYSFLKDWKKRKFAKFKKWYLKRKKEKLRLMKIEVKK